MVENWLVKDAAKVAQELIHINERNITGDTISGFGMKNRVKIFIDLIRSAMFPNIYDTVTAPDGQLADTVKRKLEQSAVLLNCMVTEVLVNQCEHREESREHCNECHEKAQACTVAFMQQLTAVAAVLNTDIHAAYDGDPAAISHEEVLLSYPGFEAVSIYRLAHLLYEHRIPLLPRIMTELGHSRTGIDINPGAKIGKYFFIDHGTGVVIGETCEIGERVKIYQGVTLGAKSFELDENGNPVKGIKRHPNIEDNVIIYSGATILGGNTVIGKGSVIGGNVWLTESVAPYSTVYIAPTDINIRSNNGR
ncbi:MAG: serine O-acetyltransferase EpsC [Christensenellaceae bacterium]|jgi:serine O-acetyltransferase